MKAVVQNDYGSSDALSLAEVNKPVPKENEVLIKVVAAGLNAGDLFSVKGSPWMIKLMVGFPKPKNHILGWDVAGIVEAVGEKVTSFKTGDEVYTGCEAAFAEYTCAKETEIAFKPTNLSFEQAAVVPTSALTALQQLRDGCKVQIGQKVLINGASGGVGTYSVQIAKALGAEVTGVCSTRNLELVQSLGADRVVDYTKEDFTKGDFQFDCILDNIASRKLSDLKRVLTPQGFIQPNSGHGGMSYVFKTFLLSMINRHHGKMFVSQITTEDLTYLKELIEEGKVKTIIDKTFSFADTPKALDYMDKEHARGKVVISIGQNN